MSTYRSVKLAKTARCARIKIEVRALCAVHDKHAAKAARLDILHMVSKNMLNLHREQDPQGGDRRRGQALQGRSLGWPQRAWSLSRTE